MNNHYANERINWVTFLQTPHDVRYERSQDAMEREQNRILSTAAHHNKKRK